MTVNNVRQLLTQVRMLPTKSGLFSRIGLVSHLACIEFDFPSISHIVSQLQAVDW